MKKFDTRTLALLSMFIAISVILARFLGVYLTESVRLSFEYFAIILAGICFGPLAGAVVGGLSDFIGATLLSGLGFYPLLIIGPILAGFSAGLLTKYLFKGRPSAPLQFVVIVAISEILANYLWGSFALSQMFGSTMGALLILRAPIKLVIAIIDTLLVYFVYTAIKPIFKKTGGASHENNGD